MMYMIEAKRLVLSSFRRTFMRNDYVGIPGEESIQAQAPAGTLEPWKETSVVGKGIPRIDAYERVSGTAVYTHDRTLPGMLHCAILRSPFAHAKVKKIDFSKAEKMPGVRAILTDATPGANIPWHDGVKGPMSRLFDPHCRHEGDEVAAVAADSPHQAWDAVKAFNVEYEQLPFVTEIEEALKEGSPKVHESGNRDGQPSVRERGDIAKGFAEADVVLEETFRTSCEIHTPLETHASIAQWDGNRLTVWDSTQGVFDIQKSLAQVLGLPLSSVRVISHYMGGGFGCKLELGKYTVIAALLARMTAHPVKVCLSREETFLCVGNRPANIIKLKAGVKRDGTLTAFHLVNTGSGGAYPAGVGVGYLVRDLYLCPNVRVEESNVFINAGTARAMRAPGFPQCSWALEQVMDALAEKIGMDPVEIRLKNVPSFSQVRSNRPFTSTGLKECLVEGAKAFGWKQAREAPRQTGAIHRGVGVGAAMWGWEGEPVSTAIVKLFPDGSVNLNLGASDIGTGTKTVMAMVVAEELGVPMERIQIEHADTATSSYAPASGGSQTVIANSPAVRKAAVEVRAKLLELAARELKCSVGELTLKDGKIRKTSEPLTEIAVEKLQALERVQMIVGVGHRDPHPEGKIPLPFAAQFAEVEVNMHTGEVKVVRCVAAHDSGRVMNRLTYENQVFGGVTMGIGFAASEQRVMDSQQTGKMLNANWHDYKIPTAMDVPVDSTCLPIDPHDTECNNTGSKGLGEPATIPTAAAIANAVYHATGIRVTQAPITPMQIVALVAAREKGEKQ
jgi:CO/xanthine dehydrogenase Mo-binding subunit